MSKKKERSIVDLTGAYPKINEFEVLDSPTTIDRLIEEIETIKALITNNETSRFIEVAIRLENMKLKLGLLNTNKYIEIR